MKPLPWLTAQCVDLEINRRQLVEIQMSTQHTHTHTLQTAHRRHTQHTTHDANDKDKDNTMTMTTAMMTPRRTLIMGIRTVRSSGVWQSLWQCWRWRFVRTAPNCLLDAINKTHTDREIRIRTGTEIEIEIEIHRYCGRVSELEA